MDMGWFCKLFTDSQSIATCLFVLGLVGVIGQLLGCIKIFSVKVGVAGVLFAGIFLGHFGLKLDAPVLGFVRDFGLILFVYAVGISVGPGFFSSFRSSGLKLNAVAVGIVLTGALLTVGISRMADIPMPVSVGLFSGATTNTPALSAGQQALKDNPTPEAVALKGSMQANPKAAQKFQGHALNKDEQAALQAEAQKMPGLGYAVAYPFGVIGIILSMLILRSCLGARVKKEEESTEKKAPILETDNFTVRNSALFGRRLEEVTSQEDLDVVVSRIASGDKVELATPDSVLQDGSVLLAVGTANALEQFCRLVGERSESDLRTVSDALISRWLVLSNKHLVGRTLAQARLIHESGTCATRVQRGEVELSPSADLVLSFGDRIRLVGTEENLQRAEAVLGNKAKSISSPDIIVPFLGILVGVLVGSFPIFIPGMPVPVKLGLAGGPLIIAILLGRAQRIGPFVTSLPASANYIVKEIGITMFLAAVGLKSGESFVATLTAGEGVRWMAWAALITAVPLLIWILIGRLCFKIRFATLIGVVSGATTDPPALAFAQTLSRPQDVSVGYATVYPLTMILRILCGQMLVLFFM